MKNITIKIFALIVLTLFISFNTASAGNGVKVFELAESGHIIEFPETNKETDLGDYLIARDTADNVGTRVQ